VGAESFSAIASAEDGALLLLRYPGDILRSTDTGRTWQEVYRGGFRVWGIGYSKSQALVAYGDSSEAVISVDSGRSWQAANGEWRAASCEWQADGRDSTLYPKPYTLYPLPAGTNSVSFADSEWWAVGEPGLICVWDAANRRWKELHRAPFSVEPDSRTAPPPSPLPLRFASQEGESKIAFSSAAHGAIAVGNRIYFTNDSAVTWSETSLPDTASISSFFLLSDTSSLVGMSDGLLYYGTAGARMTYPVFVRCDSILSDGQGAGWGTQPLQSLHPIFQIGWKDKLDGDLFVLTDSLMYSVGTDLRSATNYPLALRAGERALAASFPDAYTGFLLTDSIRRFDTLTSDGRDTSFVFDTSFVYRSLDGGATWNIVLSDIPGLTNMYFENTKTGFLCGANGLIMHTEDTGAHWARAWTLTRQAMHDIRMVNESTGYAVGDSGVVLLTQTSGRVWRLLPPEPLFSHPGTAYTGVACSGEHTVYIVANDRCYTAAIPQPINFHPHWHWPERHTLSISERPNPSSGSVEFDIRSTAKNSSEPGIRICGLDGKTISELSNMEIGIPGAWSAKADLSFLAPGAYTAIVTLDGVQAMCKFLIER